MDEEGNPIDAQAPDPAPRPSLPPAPLDEPEAAPERDEDRLSRQVPIGILFIAATIGVGLILVIVALIGLATLKS